MRRLTSTLVVILIALAAASIAYPSAWDEELTGQGKWQSLSGQTIAGTWTALLSRSGKEVQGTIELTGSPVFSGATVNGTMEDGRVAFGIVSEGGKGATFTGKLDGESVSGRWEYPAINDQGIWQGTLSSK